MRGSGRKEIREKGGTERAEGGGERKIKRKRVDKGGRIS